MRNSKLTTVLAGLITMTITAILYCVIFNDIFAIPVRWVSLIFILIAEGIAVAKILLAKKDLLAITHLVTSAAHIVIVLLMSIIFAAIFTQSIKTCVVLNIILLLVLGLVDLIVGSIRKNVNHSNKKLAESQGVMDACYAKAQSLAVVFESSNYKKDILEIAELIKYSDNSELTGDEVTIMNNLEKLDVALKENSDNTSQLILETKHVIQLRTIKMKSIKRGSY